MSNTVILVNKIFDGAYLFLKSIHMNSCTKKEKKAATKQQVLTRAQKKAAKKYWKPYKKINLLYHNFYTEKTGIFDPRYLPDNIYYNEINLHFNVHKLAKTLDNKCYYDSLFPDIPQPKILACRKSGMWFVGKELVNEEKLFDALTHGKEVFVKQAIGSQGGAGVRCIQIDPEGDFRNKIQSFAKSCPADIVIQAALQQHKDLAKFNPTSVNTMRLMTLLHNGEVKICSSVLRTGGSKGRVDNFSSGGVAVGIDENGNLKKYGYNANGDCYEAHPVTGVKFEGCHLPAFEAAKELVKKAQWYLPDFKLVSWDIATDEHAQPVMIEANLINGELDFHQLCNGPLFGDETEKMLKEIFI